MISWIHFIAKRKSTLRCRVMRRLIMSASMIALTCNAGLAAGPYDGEWLAQGSVERGCDRPTFSFIVKDNEVKSGFYQGGKGNTDRMKGHVKSDGSVMIDLGKFSGNFRAELMLTVDGTLNGTVKTPFCGKPTFVGKRVR